MWSRETRIHLFSDCTGNLTSKLDGFQHLFSAYVCVSVCVFVRACTMQNAACSSCSSSAPSLLSFPLTDQTAIALSNPSGLWKHTPRYISFEEITGSLMKYADNKRERGAGVRMTWQAIARGALVKNVQLEQSAKQASTVIKGPCVRITHSM